MKKNLLCLLIVYSIWLSLFAPFVYAQNSPKPDEPEIKKGLQFRLREGKQEETKKTAPTTVTADKLDAIETDLILRRLPQLPATEEKADFKMRSDSLPPPKTGNIISTKFPADNSQNAPSVNQSTPPALKVVRFSPDGNVPLVSDFSVTFSQPMIAVTSQTEASENVPVKLTPEVKGKWRWLGTATLIFDAEQRFPMATKFTATIPAGIKSAVGGTLEKEILWTFETPPPKVESFYDNGKTIRRDAILFASFNQDINPQAVLQKIRVTANNQKIPLRLANENEINADKAISDNIKNLQPNRWIAFCAAELLPPDLVVGITFETGLPSAEGNLTTTTPQDYSFKTFGALKFARAYCGYNDEKSVCERNEDLQIEFNNPLDAKNFDKSNIKIEPNIEDAKISVNGNQVEIEGYKKPRTVYKITIAGNLKDDFGQTLGKELLITFRTTDEEPSLYSPNQDKDLTTLDPNGKPTFSVYSTNYANLKVKIYAVKAEYYQGFYEFNQKSRGENFVPTIGKLVYDKTISVKSEPDEQTETKINLSPAFSKGFGHAILIVESPISKTKREPERIITWLQATQIGVDAFADYEKLTVFANDLKNGKPLNDAKISLSNGANGATDENGISTIELPAKYEDKGDWLIAKKGIDTAILTENNYYNSDKNWSQTAQFDGLRWFVFNDRNIYRTGETVSIKGYIRKITGGKFTDIGELGDAVSGLNYVLKDPQGNEVLKGTANTNLFGAFDFKLKLPDNLNLGTQNLTLETNSKLENKSFTHNFQVQEFRRPEFEVSANVENPVPFYLGDSATIDVEAKYYAGGFLSNAETNWNVTAKPTNYTPPNREDFTFGKFVPWWGNYGGNDDEETSSQQFKSVTGADGKHHIAVDFVSANPSRPYTINAEARVQDVNRQTFAASTSLLVHPSKLYVGLRTPKTFVQSAEQFKVETITTDIDGKTIADAPVSIIAELKDWQQVKGEWQEVTIDTQTCQIKSKSDVISCNFTAKQGGIYTITATVLDERKRRNESELNVWVAGGNVEPKRDVQEEEVQLIPNKKDYAPNDTAEILVNSPFFPAEGVLTLRRNGIVKTERFSMNSVSTVLKIPIEENYLPNIHVQVDLVGATQRIEYEDERDAKLPKRPAYASGELNLDISTVSRKLNVTAEPVEKILEPSGKTTINVAVTDNSGKAVSNSEVAVVAVDESILALTNYKIANPLDVFYQQIEAKTTDYHSRENVLLANPDDIKTGYGNGIGNGNDDGTTYSEPPPVRPKPAYSISNPDTANIKTLPDDPDELQAYLRVLGRSTGKGGKISIDGFTGGKIPPKETPPIAVRKNFDPLAIFSPSVTTDSNGKAVVDIKLPDNLTRYRITAVAVTKSKQFGAGESNITARQPLMVRPSAPRFMNFGDKIELPIVLQNQTDNPMTVNVAIRASNATLTNGNGRKVTIPANDRAEIRFPVSAEKAGIARFQIGAVSEKFADAAEIEFPVYTPATSEAFATYGTTDQNGAIIQTISAPKDVYSEFGGLEITTSSTHLQELTDAFIYLQNYPFECSEQISSRVLSVAALRDVLTAFDAKDLPSKEIIEVKMKYDIARLKQMQHADGGFNFWRSVYNNDESIPYLSVHVAHALARARAKGYDVPKEVITKSLTYLNAIESKFPNWYSQESRWAISAYALYVRDLLGDKSAVKARLLLQNATLEKLSPESIGWILSVLANDKDSTAQVEAIKRHLLNRVTETASTAHFVTNYKDGEYVLLSSNRRADGVILEALLKVESQESGVESPKSESNPKSEIQNPKSEGELIPKIVRGLLANKTKGRWANTQENAFILLALDKYFQTYEKVTPNFVAKVWLGNSFAGQQDFQGRSNDSNLISVPMNFLQTQNGNSNLILDKQGEGRLYYRIGMNYAPKNLKLEAADYGFTVTRTYEAIDNPEDVKQNPDGIWTIKAGSRVRVKVQMVAPTRRYHVALVDKLPAGLEIINSELAVSEKVPDESSKKLANFIAKIGLNIKIYAMNAPKPSRLCYTKAFGIIHI